jgi:hypothetical protein
MDVNQNQKSSDPIKLLIIKDYSQQVDWFNFSDNSDLSADSRTTPFQ